MIIMNPHRLLSPGLTWTSTSSKEGNVRYPWASVTRLRCTDPKGKFDWKKCACKLIFSALSLDNVVFPPRNWNYSKLNHIMIRERNPLQKHILIKKTKLLLSWSPQPMHPTQPTTLHFSWTRTYSLVRAQTVGQWDCEREGDHLSQSALMIVYQRLEEWSGSRWWKQALWRDHSNQICSSTQQSWGSPAQTHQPT